MVSVEEATKIVQQNLWKGGIETVPLLDSLNRVLAENVVADRDFPPFDRVTMDGIGVVSETFKQEQSDFPIAFVQAAGMPRHQLKNPQQCCEVMTGAILPDGVDAVVRYEDLDVADGIARVKLKSIERGANIHAQGSDAKQGEVLLRESLLITSAEIPVLASVGKSEVLVKALPRVALISTGDELVELNVKPLPHQIRKSNMFALAAALARYKLVPEFFHLSDNEKSISETLDVVLHQFDVIILSGGVSKGKFDLIPTMLQAKGIEKKFHQISQKPGKPMWFGVGKNKVVFALPGNPVSTFLCYYRYIEPWLLASLGTARNQAQAALAIDFAFEQPLTYFLQVKVHYESAKVMATPIPGGGSGDFVNLMEVDGFLELPKDENRFRKGDCFPCFQFR